MLGFFRRRESSTALPAYLQPQNQPLAVELTTEDLQALTEVFQHAKEAKRRERWDMSPADISGAKDELIGTLFERAGAASVTGEHAGIPLFVSEIFWIEYAVKDLETYKAPAAVVRTGRQLLAKLHFETGRARAIQHLGGVAAFPAQCPDNKRPALG
ncbi:hypothetical protein ACFZDG_35695 [Kitasatospora xanthocidica]|uniref:hypothetical protein n=1 Tax=Kitasatospora xanthocidica TaxID=83382 RepID=UPI0036EFE578